MAKLKLILQGRPLWLLFVVGAAMLIVGLLIPTTPGFRGPLFTVENAILGAVILALGGFIEQLASVDCRLAVGVPGEELARVQQMKIGQMIRDKGGEIEVRTDACDNDPRIGGNRCRKDLRQPPPIPIDSWVKPNIHSREGSICAWAEGSCGGCQFQWLA